MLVALMSMFHLSLPTKNLKKVGGRNDPFCKQIIRNNQKYTFFTKTRQGNQMTHLKPKQQPLFIQRMDSADLLGLFSQFYSR